MSEEKKYGKFKKLDTSKIPKRDKPYTKEEVNEFIKNYTRDTIDRIPIHSHIRYFSADRDPITHQVLLKKDKPVVSFKRGGFLKKKEINRNDKGEIRGYIILSDKPHTDHNGIAKNWSVQVDEHSIFYKINITTKEDLEDKVKAKDAEIAELKRQMHKLLGRTESTTDRR